MDRPLYRRLFGHSPPPELDPIESQAERGGAEAQFQLGWKYATGDGRARDEELAAKWYLKAAEQGHVLAQSNLGTLYAAGRGVRQNQSEAEMWLGKAARRGDAAAQHQLGMICYRASVRGPLPGVLEARIEAYKWLVLAAAQGHHGSEAARDTVVLTMTHEEVAEAMQRVDRFRLTLRANSANQ
jgi:hypothetical protein